MTDCQEGHINLPRISIVGGGIGGLSAALALQHFGYRVVIFEQARELREIGAGVIIPPMRCMPSTSLASANASLTKPAPAEALVTRHFQTGAVLKIRTADYAERFGAGYHQVHRVDLHAALASAVRCNDPDCVFVGHCFEDLTQDSEQVVARFTNGKTFKSDVLIGCDGNASKVRACLFGDEAVNYTGQVAFRALMPMANVPDSIKDPPLCHVRRHQSVFSPLSVASSNHHECDWGRS